MTKLHNWSAAILCGTLLSGCTLLGGGDSTVSVMQDYFGAEEKFAQHNYTKAEAMLERAYGVLKTRPAAERPGMALLDQHVNVHNYSIMTLEVLAKCKYALGKFDQIAPLIAAEEPLVNAGYTGRYSRTPTDGAKLYLNAFKAVTKLHDGDAHGANQSLGQCEPLQNLSANSNYVWLGNTGSPEFAKYLWLNTKMQALLKLKNESEAKAIDPQLPGLRQQLQITPASI
jgi:hypothetical protein